MTTIRIELIHHEIQQNIAATANPLESKPSATGLCVQEDQQKFNLKLLFSCRRFAFFRVEISWWWMAGQQVASDTNEIFLFRYFYVRQNEARKRLCRWKWTKKPRWGCGRQSENFHQMTRRDPDMLFLGAAHRWRLKFRFSLPQFQLESTAWLLFILSILFNWWPKQMQWKVFRLIEVFTRSRLKPFCSFKSIRRRNWWLSIKFFDEKEISFDGF